MHLSPIIVIAKDPRRIDQAMIFWVCVSVQSRRPRGQKALITLSRNAYWQMEMHVAQDPIASKLVKGPRNVAGPIALIVNLST